MQLPRYSLPPKLRIDFAAAWGPVYRGKRVLELLKSEGKSVCVGDYVSKLCAEALPQGLYIAIIDGKIQRGAIEYRLPPHDIQVKVSNPPGSITIEAYTSLCRLLRNPPERRVIVLVNGEEDLLALPALDCSEWPVIYGLPGVGSVFVWKGISRIIRVGSALLSLNPATIPL